MLFKQPEIKISASAELSLEKCDTLLLGFVSKNAKDPKAGASSSKVTSPRKSGFSPEIESILKQVPAVISDDLRKVALSRKHEFKAGSILSFDMFHKEQPVRVTLGLFEPSSSMFEWLQLAKKMASTAVFPIKASLVNLSIHGSQADSLSMVDSLVSAIAAGCYEFPKYQTPGKTSEKTKLELSIAITCDAENKKILSSKAVQCLAQAQMGTNLVRWLGKRAGNDLTCKAYKDYVASLSKEHGWQFEYQGKSWLTKNKAGAFLAVVQGSSHEDYGIAKITYSPKGAKKHLSLVGKGLCFDTGGHSLKASAYMLGMHGDMAGSAVALALLQVATIEKWPLKITVRLAIADNMIGPHSYKPNDVIFTAQGTTIEIIDTDAEGRMVLSDTLHFASTDKPDLLMDFATLTGACVRAIGTTYSGVFSNQGEALNMALMKAGKDSGERVWPFPMDKDFATCLESTSADTKQCREKGGVDHIEASQFLMKFVSPEIPWVHVDLSAAENPGGLAHVPSDETGFGVRFASRFVKDFFEIS